jgi:hypothetical protein
MPGPVGDQIVFFDGRKSKIHMADGSHWPQAIAEALSMGTASCLPLLEGYVSQPVRSFHDPSGRFAYQLNLVYGPPRQLRTGIEAMVLDPEQSYWSVSWPAHGRPGVHDCTLGRWMSHSRARALLGKRMTFERFCSIDLMREQLPGLLSVENIAAPLSEHPIASTAASRAEITGAA